MLRRIALLGASEEESRAFETEAQRTGHIEPVEIGPQDAMPPATAALVCSLRHAGHAIEAASKMAVCHEELLEWLGFAIDVCEQQLPGASRRVREHAARFADALGLEVKDKLTLERASYVRDIGNLRIPTYLLAKKAVLTYDEWNLLQEHTRYGAEIVKELDSLRDTEEVVRWHHECYDASGYPDGIGGEEIPLLARVMKIVDVYCAMTSPRHYRKGYTRHSDALEFIESESERFFDPALVKLFISGDIARPLTSEDSQD